MAEVKNPRRRGYTRISAKNQVTIPVEALKRAGLKPGDELRVEADGGGRIVLVRADDLIAKYAGSMSDVYTPGFLEELRNEWR